MTSITGAVQMSSQGIFVSSDKIEHDLGALAFTNDGRAFRYCKAGATALVPGKLQQSSAEDTTNFQNLTVAVSSVGATSVTTTSTPTLTVNELAGGFLTVTDGTLGVGQMLRIKSHAAVSSAVVTINLEDPIAIATTGTVKIDCMLNPFKDVIVNPSTATSSPVGVAVFNLAATEFGWLQVGGIASVLSDGGDVVGTSVIASNGTAGAVEDVASTTQSIIGTRVTGVATTEYGFIKLQGML